MTDDRRVDITDLLEHPSRNRFQLWLLISSLALMFAEGFDMQAMPYAAPLILRDWDVSRQMFGPVLSASLVGYMAGALIVSVCSDYLGRKVTIITAAFVFAAFTYAVAFATSLYELMAFRFVAGVGLGGMVPALIALNAEYVPATRRGARTSILFIAYGVGAAAGGFLPALGWRQLFEVGGILGLIAALAAVFAIPESVRLLVARKAAPRKIAAILRRARPDFPLHASDKFVVPEEERGGVPVKLLFSDGRARMTVLLWTAFILSLLGHYLLTSWLPTALADGGMRLEDARRAGGIFMLGSLFGAVLIGFVVDRKGIGGLALVFLVAAPLIVAIGVARSDMVLTVLVFLGGAALIGGQAGLVAVTGILYPTAARSTGVGWAMGMGRFGAIAAPIIGGFVLSAGISPHWLFFGAALPALACAGVLFLIVRVRRDVTGASVAASAPSSPSSSPGQVSSP